MTLEARQTLEKARFFLQKAQSTSLDHRRDYIAFLEAAIIFGRSVTFHIQKELSKKAGFSSWYEDWQARLSDSPESRFLLEQRNYALKEGQINTRGVVTISIAATMLNLHSTATATVIRGKPWYRRSPKILLNDLLRPYKEWQRTRAERQRQKISAQKARKSESASNERVDSNTVLYFADEKWSERPAVEVMAAYLCILEELVSSAESTFDANGGNAA